MRTIILSTLILLISHTAIAEQINLVQLQWSPYGGIEIEKDKFPLDADNYKFEKYNMRAQRSFSLRAIYSGQYISLQHNVTTADKNSPFTVIETAAGGFSLSGYDEDAANRNVYFIGAIGIGAGKFTFKQAIVDDWEAMLEINLEGGVEISKHLLVGAGFTYQHFGKPGDSKAELGSLYVSTGVRF